MTTIICFGDQTSSTFLIIPSVSQVKITQSPRTDNFVIVNVFNSVTSSRVTGNRNFARKEELIYETIAALTSNTTCPMSAILGDSTCTVLPSDIYVAKKRHSLDALWSLGRKSVFCTFLRVLYRVCNARSAFHTWVHNLYPVRNA